MRPDPPKTRAWFDAGMRLEVEDDGQSLENEG